jgi:hypothetical protein
MRKILLSILLFVVCLAANAQNAGLATMWKKGYYYDNSGKKVSGFLADYSHNVNLFHPNDNYFLFSTVDDTAYNATKSVKVFSKDIKSFVAGTDTFVVSNSDKIKKTPFLAVLVNNDLKLYAVEMWRGTAASSFGLIGLAAAAATNNMLVMDYTYYYGTDPDNLTKLTHKEFMDVMSKMMADKPNVVAKIQDKTYRYSDMKELLTFYITGKYPDNKR